MCISNVHIYFIRNKLRKAYLYVYFPVLLQGVIATGSCSNLHGSCNLQVKYYLECIIKKLLIMIMTNK